MAKKMVNDGEWVKCPFLGILTLFGVDKDICLIPKKETTR